MRPASIPPAAALPPGCAWPSRRIDSLAVTPLSALTVLAEAKRTNSSSSSAAALPNHTNTSSHQASAHIPAMQSAQAASSSESEQLSTVLHTLQREGDAMEGGQKAARWHPAHARTVQTLRRVQEQLRSMLTTASEAASSNGAVVAPALALPAPWLPLLHGALLRLSLHPSAAARFLVAQTVHLLLAALLHWASRCQAPSAACSFPQWTLDIFAAAGQAAATQRHDKDPAAARIWASICALVGLGQALPVQQTAADWDARLRAVWRAQEEAEKLALERSVSSSSNSGAERSPPQHTKRNVGQHALSVGIPSSMSDNRRSSVDGISDGGSSVPHSPQLASSTITTTVGGASCSTTTAGGGVHDDDDEVVDDGDESKSDGDSQPSQVLVEDDDEHDDDDEDIDVRFINAYRLVDRNRRLADREESSDEDEEMPQRKQSMPQDLPVVLPVDVAAVPSTSDRMLSDSEQQHLHQDPVALQHAVVASPGAVMPLLSRVESDASVASASTSTAMESDTTSRPMTADDPNNITDTTTQEGGTGTRGEDANEGAVLPSQDQQEDDAAAAAAAPIVRTLPAQPLSIAQELAFASPFHALMQLPLSSAFAQQQFQQCLHHFTTLSAMEASYQEDESWMAFVLHTVHAHSSEDEEAAAPSSSVSSSSSSSSSSGSSAPPSLTPLLTTNRALASFALLTSCAKYLIKYHLRSNYGAALPTLTHLDRVLTSHLKARPLDHVNGDIIGGGGFGASSQQPRFRDNASSFASRVPLQRMLLFMDTFEKLIQHAATGSTSLPPSLSDTRSCDFFSANVQSCSTFFTRIRAKLVQASVLADMPTYTVHHAQALLQSMLQALSHVWNEQPTSSQQQQQSSSSSSSSSSSRSNASSVPNSPSNGPMVALSHVDLVNHRQLLETVQELSQAYVQLGNAPAIAALAQLLRSRRLVLPQSNPIGLSFVRPLSLFSLCFFLPGAELSAGGRYEEAMQAYKRVLAECGQCWTPSVLLDSGGGFGSGPPLLLPNSIALQSCIRGLSVCHARVDVGGGDDGVAALASDQSWTDSIASMWDSLLASIRQTCPSVLQPLLPSLHTVQEVMRWNIHATAAHAARVIDRVVSRIGASNQLDEQTHQQLADSTAQLRHSLRFSIGGLRPVDANAAAAAGVPTAFLHLTAEQQLSLSDDLMLLSIGQRLLGQDGRNSSGADDMPEIDDLHLSAAFSLTSWNQTAALSGALLQHRLPEPSLLPTVNQPPSMLSILACLELPGPARAMLHKQCANALAFVDENVAAAVRLAPIAAPSIMRLMDSRSLAQLRRTQRALQSPSSSHALASQSNTAAATSIVFAQQSLRTGNLRQASALLFEVASSPIDIALWEHAALLQAVCGLLTGGDPSLALEQLHQLAGFLLPTVSTGTGAILQFALSPAVPLPPTSAPATNVSELAFSYLLEHVQHASFASSSVQAQMHIGAILHGALQRHSLSPHFWHAHAHLFFMRALQLTALPASYVPFFQLERELDEMGGGGGGGMGGGGAAMASMRSKQRRLRMAGYPSASIDGQVHPIPHDGTEDSSREEGDEDFERVRQLVLHCFKIDPLSSASTAMAALAAIVHAVNVAIEAPPLEVVGSLQRSSSLGHSAPPLQVAPQSLPTAAAAWMPRLHLPLWSAMCKVLPHLVQDAMFSTFHAEALLFCSRRAVRVLAYADSALHSTVQAIQLLCNEPSTAAYAARHPARSRAELPLALLTLLTRFGGCLDVSSLTPLLLLPPRIFLDIFPQLYARLMHPHPLVRAWIHALVVRVGESYPQQAVFPLCVGMHEEEEWRRDEQRCAQIESNSMDSDNATASVDSIVSPMGGSHGGLASITPKHDMLLRIVMAIDRRAVGSILAQMREPNAPPLQQSVQELFSYGPHSFAVTSALRSQSNAAGPSPSSFLTLLSAVHRMVVELNRIAFLWDDNFLHEFRRLQSELDLSEGGSAAGGFANTGRGRMLHDEISLMIHQWRVANPPMRPPPSYAFTAGGQQQNMAANKQQQQQQQAAAVEVPFTPAFLEQLQQRYTLIIAPLLLPLVELHRTTLCAPAATPYELHFQRKYSRTLSTLLQTLQKPDVARLTRPSLLWPSIHSKVSDLRRQMSRMALLHMKDISPFLARWHARQVQAFASAKPAYSPKMQRNVSGARMRVDPASAYSWYASLSAAHAPPLYLAGMSGSTEALFEESHPYPLDDDSDSDPALASLSSLPGVFVQSFGPQVEVMRSKTRPKKFQLSGSDGAQHTYLLKSREDLHLDQRMMHMLRVANRTMYQNWRACHNPDPRWHCLQRNRVGGEAHHCHSSPAALYARTFSVTPLSDRSGWLRWVDGVFPIFELVKQEQARRKEREDRARLNAASNPGAGAAGGKPKNMLQSAAAAMKASDLFAHKLAVHCARAGLPKHIARRDVPLGVLLNVFVEMEQESGAESVHLLSRELWLSSCSAGELYLKQLALTRSLSTMSVLGYILGLGDRHLGNIMISLARGDVLHIDWNVALERGLKLPIPEVIPFRLTGILINAGGLVMSQPQAHAGVFHATAMQTLHSVRSSQHVFSQLLSHTFVYHPLAEWQSLSAKPFLLLRKNADLRMRTMLLQQTTQQPPQLQQQQSQDGQTFEHRLVTSSAPPMREEKNKHAVSAVKRIEQKLCGIEPIWSPANGLIGTGGVPSIAALVPLSVPAHASLLIAESQRKENLARLYEGWAPWI